MTRRNFKPASAGTFALLVLGALLGCIHKPLSVQPLPERASIVVFVHTPGNMKLPSHDNGADGISVSVPRTDFKEHELVSPDLTTPSQAEKNACDVTFRIKLEGVQSYPGKPRIPDPFQTITFDVPAGWRPKDPFVTMSFPSTDVVNFLGPLYPVTFQSGVTAQVPLTEILTFPAEDLRQVQLLQTRVERCGTGKPKEEVKRFPPVKCEHAMERYKDYFSTPESIWGDQDMSERLALKKRLQNCTKGTYFYFMGVGLPPKVYNADPTAGMKHGIDFFNNKLLPAIFGSEDKVPPARRLSSVGSQLIGKNIPYHWGQTTLLPNGVQFGYAGISITANVYEHGNAMLMPAGFAYPPPRPRSVPVAYASTENCTSPPTILR